MSVDSVGWLAWRFVRGRTRLVGLAIGRKHTGAVGERAMQPLRASSARIHGERPEAAPYESIRLASCVSF